MRGDKIFISGWSYIYTIDICMYDIIRYIYLALLRLASVDL